MSKILRICMLNTDVPAPRVSTERFPTYGQIFHNLITATASRVSPDITIESTDYDVKKGEYPESLSDVDMIIISGSVSSTYADEEWIRRLDQYILDVYSNHPQVKMFGSCFGHQIICQSLLKGFGVTVEPDVKGWELGVHEITLEKQFCEAIKSLHLETSLGNVTSANKNETLRIQLIHGDQVVVPSLEALPSSWMRVGYTKHCAIQGMYEAERVFTLQGHFEFDRFINRETMKVFFSSWEAEQLNEALGTADADDDSERASEMLLRFMQDDCPLGASPP